MKACCGSALQSLFKAMAIEANHSGSIFLQLAEAKDCSNTFQNLHQSSNLAKCELQDLIYSSTAELCSSTIDAIISFLGIERYNAFRSNCTNLYASNYSDETCFNCVMSYRQSLQALRKGDSSNGNRCNEALLVSLASSDVDSQNWVRGTFSCLWNEIGKISQFSFMEHIPFHCLVWMFLFPCVSEFSWPAQTHGIGEWTEIEP